MPTALNLCIEKVMAKYPADVIHYGPLLDRLALREGDTTFFLNYIGTTKKPPDVRLQENYARAMPHSRLKYLFRLILEGQWKVFEFTALRHHLAQPEGHRLTALRLLRTHPDAAKKEDLLVDVARPFLLNTAYGSRDVQFGLSRLSDEQNRSLLQ